MSAPVAEARAVPAGASVWPQFPSLYEISTWVWLTDLSKKYGKTVDLSSVPAVEWDAIAAYGFDAVWLMGVWERSPAGIAIANKNKTLLESFHRALPDFHTEDNVGSPYSIRRYVVDKHFGGPEGLAVARRELAKRGMNLLLDFVPNHVAPDHPWATDHSEYFIRGTKEEAETNPEAFVKVPDGVCACGKDPYFAPWPDVLQLNAFDAGLRKAVIETVSGIAEQCDGVRCDMAMLMLNSVFQQTWGGRAGPQPATEYWSEVISGVRQQHPSFLFIAEAYWDMEWELQQKGFNFCYDKKLYDRLVNGSAESVRLHLSADDAYQMKLVRFIENHDEPRSAATFPPAKLRTAALTTATQPGVRMFYEGQFEGRKVQLPVFLGRRPDEPADKDLQGFYKKLLGAIDRPVFREHGWTLCERTGWPDNSSFLSVVAWAWRKGEERYLILVNLSDAPAQARVKVPWDDVAGGMWILADRLSRERYERVGGELVSPGLYVEMKPWGFNFFELSRKDDGEKSKV
jgi:Alpha amylase, catalytic domain